MKKTLLLIIVMPMLMGASCDIQKPINDQSREITFEKKQECAKYKNGIEDELNKTVNVFQQDGSLTAYYDLGGPFYSPLIDSCVYNYELILKGKNDSLWSSNLVLKDALTKELLLSSGLIDMNDFENYTLKKNDFQLQISSYK